MQVQLSVTCTQNQWRHWIYDTVCELCITLCIGSKFSMRLPSHWRQPCLIHCFCFKKRPTLSVLIIFFSVISGWLHNNTGRGPTCNCSAINSTSNDLTCSVTYADGSYNPILARITWTADGYFFASTTPSPLLDRIAVNYVHTFTSSITVDVNDQRIFRCNLTFTAPMNISISYIARNAPDFFAPCTAPCEFESRCYSRWDDYCVCIDSQTIEIRLS